MQGEAGKQRDLFDVSVVAGHLLPAGSVFAFLAEHRSRLFPDELFADLFPSGRGRPSIPGEVVASVIVLQALHAMTDREAADAVTFDLRWKAACGYSIDAAGFHPTTLVYWRKRLAASDRPQRVFEVVREVITQTGALAGKHRRALDSTVLDDAVARQDTVTQLIAAIRRVARDVPDAKDLVVADARACQVFCVSDLVFGLQVGVDSFGVGQSELLEGLFPVGGHGAFDESTFGCAFRASPEPSFFGAVTGPFVLDVADCQP